MSLGFFFMKTEQIILPTSWSIVILTGFAKIIWAHYMFFILILYYLAKLNCSSLVWSSLSLECPSLASKQIPTHPSKPTSNVSSSKKPSLTMPMRISLDSFHMVEPCSPFVSGSIYSRQGRGEGPWVWVWRTSLALCGTLPLVDSPPRLDPFGLLCLHLLVPLTHCPSLPSLSSQPGSPLEH